MDLKRWTMWMFFVSLLWSLASANNDDCKYNTRLTDCCETQNQHNLTFLVRYDGLYSPVLYIGDNYTQPYCNCSGDVTGLVSALYIDHTTFPSTLWDHEKKMPKVNSTESMLLLSRWHLQRKATIYYLEGDCYDFINTTMVRDTTQHTEHQPLTDPPAGETETCKAKCLKAAACDMAVYKEDTCKSMKRPARPAGQGQGQGTSNGADPNDDKWYFVNITSEMCINCNNPVQKPEQELILTDIIDFPVVLPKEPEEPLDAEVAGKVMSMFTDSFIRDLNDSSTVAMELGDSITGVLMKMDPRDTEEVSFAYTRINESFNILSERKVLDRFSRSVTVTKQAFERAMAMNISEPFAAVFRFLNMDKDEYNSSVLGDEVLAIEMGAVIKNLTDTINVNFWNSHYEGIPSCHSWNGTGGRPQWTSDGCETVQSGMNVTCKCSHMTFFAVLLTPLNETISSSDLKTLTIISNIGCGVSMFFLGVVLFLHFVMRKGRSSDCTQILIHLVLAMFLLDFSFLINEYIAKTKNAAGCAVMAATMHYFMLSTFTWFAVHAFHLCLQLHHGGKVQVQRYVIKVAVFSWVTPGVITSVLLGVGKYGELTIDTGNAATSVSMCWILDNDVHYIVNIGYYALVFLFTFSTFILMLTWLCRMSQIQKKKGSQGTSGSGGSAGSAGSGGPGGSSCQWIVTVMGLCCILGVTWSCAFFAYGVFRVPAYYCFTLLNSFQGFFLFVYYYKSSSVMDREYSSSSSNTTLKTNLDEILNPYANYGNKPKPE